MVEVIVHGRKTSSNVQLVMWGAAELGLEVTRRDVGGRFGGTQTEAYRWMHPMGLVPVLEDGKTVLFESAAILRYLVGRYGPGPFSMEPRADAWAEWGKNTFCAAFTQPIFWAFYRAPQAERDMDGVLTALRRFEQLAGIAMSQRGAGRWLLGEQISIADVMVSHVLYRYFTLDLPREAPEGLADYYALMQTRPAFREHVMVDYSELAGRSSF